MPALMLSSRHTSKDLDNNFINHEFSKFPTYINYILHCYLNSLIVQHTLNYILCCYFNNLHSSSATCAMLLSTDSHSLQCHMTTRSSGQVCILILIMCQIIQIFISFSSSWSFPIKFANCH